MRKCQQKMLICIFRGHFLTAISRTAHTDCRTAGQDLDAPPAPGTQVGQPSTNLSLSLVSVFHFYSPDVVSS